MTCPSVRGHQRGMALISGLLLLLVVTILGMSMFRSFAIQAKIAGNTREKQRALHAAEGAQGYAEWWVSQSGGGNATLGNPCNAVITITAPIDVQVCSNVLDTASVTMTNGPWKSGGSTVGYVYKPPGMVLTGSDSYNQYPEFYIAFLNGQYDKQSGTQTNNYRVDAAATGGSANTVAVVESAYQVQVTYTTQNSNTKFYSLTGP